MPNTYVALRTETVAVSTASVNFSLSGISGYTDLVMIINGGLTTNNQSFRWQFNGDTASNYSYTYLAGNGSTASSNRASNASGINAYHVSGQSDSALKNNVIFNLQNYANTTTNKTCLIRGNTDLETAATVGLWRNTAAITSILVATTNGNIQAGTTISLYGIANADQGAAKATGGIITEDSTYWYHTFGASGAFIPKQSLTCDVLVVAGGGGGGLSYGGGGGAGAVAYYASQSLTAISHNVTVGAGGARCTTAGTRGGNGVNSQFASLTAATGGGAGGASENASQKTGANGGSGGGGGGADATQSYTGTNAGGTGSQGNNGGSGTGISGIGSAGGGGGGAGAAGANAFVSSPNTRNAGNGGAGISTYSSWGIPTGIGENVAGTYYIAGGGGGGEYGTGVSGLGGYGGGAAGTAGGVAVNAIANTGGGGGGTGSGTASNGASGVVIIRYSK